MGLRDDGTTNSTLTISDNYTIFDVNVRLDISHLRVSELAVSLIAPDGTSIALILGGVGGEGDNFTNTYLDDSAAAPITAGTAPFTGTYRPEYPLSRFNGKNVQGTWTLEVRDRERRNRGTLNSWSLFIIGPVAGSPLRAIPAATTEPVVAPLTEAALAPVRREAVARW